MDRTEAVQLLHVTFPTTETALKSAFRRRALDVHPDRNKSPNAAAEFQRLQGAYEALVGDVEVVLCVEAQACCDDGTSLSELGRGLGPAINGRPCTDCRGAGFQMYTTAESSECPDCLPVYSGLGLWGVAYQWRCPRCKGTGKFSRNGAVVGDCFRCKGQGWIRTRENHCETCHGYGRVSQKIQRRYSRCTACNGAGEVRIYNPVLPKGLLGFGT